MCAGFSLSVSRGSISLSPSIGMLCRVRRSIIVCLVFAFCKYLLLVSDLRSSKRLVAFTILLIEIFRVMVCLCSIDVTYVMPISDHFFKIYQYITCELSYYNNIIIFVAPFLYLNTFFCGKYVNL